MEDKIESISGELRDLENTARWRRDLANVTLSLPNGTLSWPVFLQIMHSYQALLGEIMAWELPSDKLFAGFVIEEQLNRFKSLTDYFGLSMSWSALHYALIALGRNTKVTEEQRRLLLQAHNCSMTQLVQSVHDWPRLIVLTSAGHVQLRNWTLGPDAKLQELTYQVVVPGDVRELRVSVHSVRLALLLWRLHALTQHGRRRLQEVPTNTWGSFYCKWDWQNGMELLLWELRAHYLSTSYFEVNTASGSVLLEPFVNTKVNMFPTAHFVSETDTCMGHNMQTCVDQCEWELYLAQCHCIPWSLLYLGVNDNHTVCQSVCMLPENICQQDCQLHAQHPCDKTVYRLERSQEQIEPFQWKRLFWDGILDDTLEVVPDTPVTAVELSLPQSHSHGVYLEVYSMTISDLISRIGGLLEFFLGINVVAIVHMIVYIIQHLRFSVRNLTAELQSLEEKVQKFRKKKRRKPKRTYGFLVANRWYEETTLTGWSYINNASTTVEAGFWAALLLIFFGLTVHSVAEALADYAETPKQTTLHMALQNSERGIENFSIVLEVSFFEYLRNDLIDTVDKLYALDYYVNSCVHAMEALDESYLYSWDLIATEVHESIASLTRDETFLSKLAEEAALKQNEMPTETFANWFTNASNSLTQEMGIYLNEFNYYSLSDPIEEKFKEFLWPNLLWVLHVLESIKLGVDPRWKALHDFQLINGPPNKFHKHQEARDILTKNAINPKQLLQAASDHLLPQINVSHAEVHLIDAKNDMSQSVQQLTFKVLPAKENDQLILNLYSYSISLHQIAWRSLADYITVKLNELNSFKIQSCHGGELDKHLLWRGLLHDLFLFREHILEVDSLTLEFPSAKIRLEPFSDAKLVLQPTGDFSIPQTDDCYRDSLDACESGCVLDWHKRHCDCVPWMVYFLAQDIALCHGPCLIENHTAQQNCSAHCDRRIQIKCRSSTYKVQTTHLQVIRHHHYDIHKQRYFVNPAQPVYSVSISKAQIHRHPVFNEKYQISFGNLVANLGGVFEIWLGINIIGIIHLIVFIVRQSKQVKRWRNKQKNTSTYERGDFS